MVKSEDIIQAALKYIGTSYSKLDCQAFVEKAMADCGLKKDLAGSNTWYRYLAKHGWVGSPEECKAKFGKVPKGAFLFILEQDGKEPQQYRSDGIGNVSHIGIYTGMTGKEMVKASGKQNAGAYNFGSGAIHSSASKGSVCTSDFRGKTIRGGWSGVGLWDQIDYGIDKKIGDNTMGETYQAKVIGGALKLREQPQKNAEQLCLIPNGKIITVVDEVTGWAKTSYSGYDGWVMKDYLEKIEATEEKILVSKKDAETVLDIVSDWLGYRG